MAESSRRIKRVRGGLLPSGVPAGLGRDQSGFAALAGGFGAVRTAADQIQELRDASDRTRVQGELNQAVRDEAAANRQGIADGSIDPAQFEAGDDLDFYVDDRIAKLESRFAEITGKTGNRADQERLDQVKQETISATREQAQIQQVAALATRVAQDQAEASNAIAADVGDGSASYDLGLVRNEELREAAPLSAERRRELEVKQTTGLALAGVTGAITRAAFDDAIDIIDHPKTIDAMSANDRETLRARVLRAEKQHTANIASGMESRNKLLVDKYEREIDREEHTDDIRIRQDPRLLPEQKDELTIAIRDKREWRIAVDRDLAIRRTDPHALPAARHKELDDIVFNKIYRDVKEVNPDMPDESALALADFWFVTDSGGLPAPSSYSRMMAAVDAPTDENLEYIMTMVGAINQDHPNLLAARADMDPVRKLYHETQILTEMGLPVEEVAATRQAERNRSKQQQDMIAAEWALITEEEKQDQFDSAVGQGWFFQMDRVGYDTPAAMQLRSTWATFYATAFQQTGSRKLATVRATSWLNAEWGTFRMSPITGLDLPKPMRYPPNQFVQDFDNLDGKWWPQDIGQDLVELGYLSSTSPDQLARVTFYVTDLTRATLYDNTPENVKYRGVQYGVKIDGEPHTIDTGELLHVGAVFPESAHRKIEAQRNLDRYNKFENGADVSAARKKGGKLIGLALEAQQSTLDKGLRALQYGTPSKYGAEDVIMQRELDSRRARQNE